MSKKQSKKQSRKKQGKSKRRATSSIKDHQRQGGKLIPPFLKFPNLSFQSWRDDRLPEMLWAVLLVGNIERDHALAIFRHVADAGLPLKELNGNFDITHTGITQLPDDHPSRFIDIICKSPEARKALVPLLYFEQLPGRAVWQEFLGDIKAPPDWQPLIIAVAKTLWHQSEEATDCRWIRLLFSIFTGGLAFTEEMAETVKEIINYPNYGDLRKVRPSIRAAESMCNEKSAMSQEWTRTFWQQCFRDTSCVNSQNPVVQSSGAIGTTRKQVLDVRRDLLVRFFDTIEETSVNPRQDTVFGTSLYSLAMLEELMRVGAANSIGGRFHLRAILEGFVTLKYLSVKADSKLWQSHRVYGAGQAKLALLKIQDDDYKPEYITEEALDELANEDMWQEFVEINLVHWDRANLRKLAEVAGVKDLYDRYYGWTSAYLHSHWGPIRQTSFQTCLNPLHRGHRIPRSSVPMLDDVLPDACLLTDLILEILEQEFPPFPSRVSL